MIIDTSYLEPLYQAELKKSYKELLNYLIDLNLDEKFFKKLNIYYEKYITANKVLYVPVTIHFLLHYYYGKENNNISSLHKAYKIFTQDFAVGVRGYYHDKFMECKKYENYKIIKYEEKYGPERAKLVKQRISFSMSNLDKDIINKRNKSIEKYAKKRPKSHNNAISRGRIKKLIEIKSQKIYKDIKEASEKTGICITYIRQCCQGKRKLDNHHFYYYNQFEELTKDLL